MDMIALGGTGRRTTRLGFGCSSVMGGLGRLESLAMLESAWDAGIRHFDVAPMYGFGEAEGCLGEFLARHRGQVTVTTKFGISPTSGGPVARLARAVARPVVGPIMRRLRKRGGASVAAGSFLPGPETPATLRPANPIFRAAEAKRSLERSLQALRTERIDVWLLHEVAAVDLVHDDLLRFLEDSVTAGTIGTFGAGTERNQIAALLAQHPAYCPTLQYEWSVFHPVPSPSAVFRMHHRSLTSNFGSLHAALVAERERCTRWSAQVGADLADAAVLARLMLKAALVLNPESVILFSSKKAHHIQANVALAEDDALAAPAESLYRVIQAELAAG